MTSNDTNAVLVSCALFTIVIASSVTFATTFSVILPSELPLDSVLFLIISGKIDALSVMFADVVLIASVAFASTYVTLLNKVSVTFVSANRGRVELTIAVTVELLSNEDGGDIEVAFA